MLRHREGFGSGSAKEVVALGEALGQCSGEFGRPGRRSSVPIPTPNDSGGGYVGWHKGCQKIAFSMRISDMYSNLP